MNIKFLILIFVVNSKNLFSQTYFVSEVFANALGAKANLKSQWLELKNREQAIKLHEIKLEIFEDKASPLTVHKFLKDISFEDYLLIAHHENLGLTHCLNKQLKIIVMPELNLSKKQKICVTLNQDKPACITLGGQIFLDGVSLFRYYEKDHIGALWQNEPCQLLDGIFATPGLPDRACAHDPGFATKITVDCFLNKPDAYTLNYASFHDLQGHKPEITTKTFDPKTRKFSVNLKDADKHDRWRSSLCVAPQNSHLLCHELEPLKDLSPALSKWPTLMGEDLSLETRDIVGLSDSILLASKKPQEKHPPISLKLEALSAHKRVLKISLSQEIPLNYRLLNKSGDILSQGVLTKAGEYRLYFSSSDFYYNIILENKNIYLNKKLDISLSINKTQSCSTHDISNTSNTSIIYLILTYAWLVRRRHK